MCVQGRYLDRDESDLAYVRRIAAKGDEGAIPLLERLRFLEIAAAILDEFVAVRLPVVAAPSRAVVHAGIASLRCEILRCLGGILPQLAEAGVALVFPGAVGHDHNPTVDAAVIDAAFRRTLLPGLTPLTVDREHPFPQLLHGQRALLLASDQEDGGEAKPLIVPLSCNLPEYVSLAPGRWMRSDHLLRVCVDRLLPGRRIRSAALIRVLRLNDLPIADDFRSLRDEVSRGLEERLRNPVSCIEADEHAPGHLLRLAAAHLFKDDGAGDGHICTLPWDAIAGLTGLRQLAEKHIARDALRCRTHKPVPLPAFEQHGGDLFAAMAEGDFLLHSPYHDFAAFTSLLRQAARDPDVVAIRQTLYRTEESVVENLLEAARRGKDVTVVVEIEARENERQNIELSVELERAGAHIVHGIVGLKVHAKLLHIVRREDEALREYAVFSTGNFHPGNAATYGDLTLFTAEPGLAADLRGVLNYVTGHLPAPHSGQLVVAPHALRDTLLECIAREAANAREGQPSGIWFKVNSLLDRAIIDALYDAAAAGVPVRGCVRRHCALRPGMADAAAGIEIRSLIGRFLEHTRLICFGNGAPLPSPRARIFLASADWMPRNFDERVEVLVPINDPRLRQALLHYYMPAYLEDDSDSWVLDADGAYHRLDSTGRSAQEGFLRDPLPVAPAITR